MDELFKIRHSLAHLLAAAVTELYPKAKPTIGPAIENGFYYDFDLPEKISENDLIRIEAKMRELAKSWREFTRLEKTPAEARKFFAANPYKLALIEELEKTKEQITFYTAGGFSDLCRGGHVKNFQQVDLAGFKLDRTAGAYWRGDEKNQMLTRIYGLAFASEKDLKDFLQKRAEAEKRDHKKIGPALDLFVFSDLVGSGFPLWTPRGTLVRDLLDSFVWSLRQKYGYERVDIPHLAKQELFKKSGHWNKFRNELLQIKTREGHWFVLKPMNCPHHIQIFNRRHWSYKELPVRYASTTKVYRDEQSGEIAGIVRTRAFTQDDAHVFCRAHQIRDEVQKIWRIVKNFYGAFNIKFKTVRLSGYDPGQKEKYLGGEERWQKAEKELRAVSEFEETELREAIGEAAFYGPKLDFMIEDALGREWQVGTIQLDFNMPERFDLFCLNEKGEKEQLVMIHAAIMGSIERFLAMLIEHTNGNFPLWLAPVQVRVLTISERQNDFGEAIYQKLLAAGIRAEKHFENETLAKKIKEGKLAKTPYLIVVGEKEATAQKLTAESRHGKIENITIDDFIIKLQKEIREKS